MRKRRLREYVCKAVCFETKDEKRPFYIPSFSYSQAVQIAIEKANLDPKDWYIVVKISKRTKE